MVLIHKRAVGVFYDHQSAEAALTELHTSGFPMQKISVIEPDGSRRRWSPGIVVRDRFDNTRYNFPTERASFYESRLSQGHYLIVVEGTEEQILHAQSILNRRGIQDWGIYDYDDDVPDTHVAGMGKHKRAVGAFPNRRDAEDALHELRDSGFPMDRVSVIVRDAERGEEIAGAPVRDTVGNKAEEGAAVGALSGGVLGGLTGLLVGLGTLAIPGVGPVMLAGATATAIASTLAGGAIGAVAGSLLGALIGLGIPEERARAYSERVARGEFLVIVDGTDEEIARAETILSGRGIQDYGVYDIPESDAGAIAGRVPARDIPTRKHAIGLFSNLPDAELAVDDLRNAGFPLSQVSMVAQRFDRHEPFTGVDVRDRFDAMRMGLPDERARFYNDRIERGEYMVIVSGTDDDIHRAASILSDRGIREWQVYDPMAIDTTASPVMSDVDWTQPYKRAVGVFSHRRDAELAIHDLEQAGFPLNQITLIARHVEPQNLFANMAMRVRDRFDDMRMGLPEERVRFYNDRVEQGDYVVVVYGTDDEMHRAASILNNRGIQHWQVFDPTAPGYIGATGATPVVSGAGLAHHQRAVGLFSNRHDAELAINDLRNAGFPLNQITLIAQHVEPQGFFANLAMPVRDRFDDMRMGLSDERARFYSDRITQGDYAVIVDGTEEEIRRAASILNARGIQHWQIYDSTMPGHIGATGAGAVVSGTGLGHHKRAVGLFSNRRDAELAIEDLRNAGFPLGQITLIAQHVEPQGFFANLAMRVRDRFDDMRTGLSDDRARLYSDRIARGDYAVIVDGTEEEIRRAASILNARGIEEFGIYDYPERSVTGEPRVTIVDRREQTL